MAIQVIDGGREIKFLSASNNKTIIPIPHIDTGGLRNNYMLEFGADGIPIMPEIILAQRGGHKIGRINKPYDEKGFLIEQSSSKIHM